MSLKKNLLKRLIVFFMFGIFAAISLYAKPDARMIIANPGEDAETEMRIGWHTDPGVDGSFIEYTKKTDTEWKDAKKIIGTYSVSNTWNGIDTRIGSTTFTQDITVNKYGVVLRELEPNTEYMYRVGLTELCEPRFFKTAGGDEFNFAWISDYHHYDPLPNRLKNAMKMISTLISSNKEIDFILSTGDDVAYGGSYSYWQDLLASDHFRDYMWVTTNGNHDNMDISNSKNTPAFYGDTHNNPRNGYSGQEGVSYFFKYKNSLWIVLNSEDLNSAAQVPKAQEWAANVIKRNPSQYIFFVQHYQWFSGNTGSYSSKGFTRWNEFFDKWGVDIAFGGNEHIYVRTKPIYNKLVSTEPGKGTVYLQAPSSDGDRGVTLSASISNNVDKIASRWANGLTTIGGSFVTVTENGVEVALYDHTGLSRDYEEIVANRPDPNTLPPVVTYVEPEVLTDVKTGVPMELVFSGKMDRASVESAISLSPSAPISFTWINNNTISIDITKLEYSTNYVLTVDGSIAKNAITGQQLDGANSGTAGSNYVLNFTTKAEEVVANFSAAECAKELFRCGFDTQEEMSAWTAKVTNTESTWHLATAPRITGIPEFSAINPDSKYSAAVWYSRTPQDETITSPSISIPAGAKCSFYACFNGVWTMDANLTLYVNPEDGTPTKVFDAFLWSQDNNHTDPKWLPFNIDLANYAGKKVTFTFSYKGTYGDDALVDDFVVSSLDISGNSTVEILEGENVHFQDASTGSPTSWAWVFDGAVTTTSTEQNPVINYNAAGEYKVTLTASNATSSDTKSIEKFVVVRGVAPTAVIGLPEEGYLSPWMGVYLPKDVEVTFKDKSKGNPNQWAWQLPNSNTPTSSVQNPTVVYSTPGVYSVGLRVTNATGTHSDQYNNAIQIGGVQNIWNIEMNEANSIAPIALGGWFGYYGGSNWVDMPGFAEYFHKPLAKGMIHSIDIFFASVSTITPDAEIKVSVMSNVDGLPGEVLGSSVLKASELKFKAGEYLSTSFAFQEPVSVDTDFFVSIEGIPCNTDNTGEDAIAMYCSPRRAAGAKSTVYHLLDELDENYQPTGVRKWWKNSDEFLSFAISPKFEYDDGSGVSATQIADITCDILVNNGNINAITNGTLENMSVFNISGQLIISTTNNFIAASDWNKGIYIVKTIVSGKQFVRKIKI